MVAAAAPNAWWNAAEGRVHTTVLEYVDRVEREQTDLFDRFVKLEALYDPNAASRGSSEQLGLVTENVIASNIDTVAAVVAATDVRARFQTDDGDWSTQRTARHLEWYAEGLATLLGVHDKCRDAFKLGAALKGTGLIKVYVDQWDEVCVEHVAVDDIIVDEKECRGGEAAPKQLHQRKTNVDRDELIAQFPDYEEEIRRAQTGEVRAWRTWAGYRPLEGQDIVVIESWRLPLGRKGSKGYRPGRHTIVIDGCDLLDEEWHKPFFPFAKIVWGKRAGWYGISGAERIAGHQRALNKRNWQIDRLLDQMAVPTTYVRPPDANLAVKTTSRLGTVAVVKSDYPHTVIPPAVSGETYEHRSELKASAFEEFGVSRMAASAAKPSGIDSGVAMREYRDQTTQRFALQEKAFERLVLDVIVLILDCCKDLGDDAPVVMHRTKFGRKSIPWADVDMGDVRVQIAAASTLSRTPAGRTQMVIEWAQAGVISQDEARRLMNHPDLEHAISLYTAALEDIERTIEAIEDGEILMPEPYQNLKLGVWRMQMAYLKDVGDGAPEEILEGLRQWITQAAFVLSSAEAPVANDNAMGAPAGAPAPGPSPDMMAEAPMGAAPTAALAPEAMNLRAS